MPCVSVLTVRCATSFAALINTAWPSIHAAGGIETSYCCASLNEPQPLPCWLQVMQEIQQERQAMLASGSGDPDGGAGPAAAAAGAPAGAAAGHGGRAAEVIVIDSDDDTGQQAAAAERGAGPGEPAAAALQHEAAAAPVLVVCQDTFTAGQVRQCTESVHLTALPLWNLYSMQLSLRHEGMHAWVGRCVSWQQCRHSFSSTCPLSTARPAAAGGAEERRPNRPHDPPVPRLPAGGGTVLQRT